MKGIIRKASAALCCLAAVGGMGCINGYRDLVDPCYPQRYDAEARHEVATSYAPQIANGHVLDQTIWNYDFEPGTDKLTGGGREHLAYMARRRPQPDPVVYLQTAPAEEVGYDPAKPDEMADKRTELDAKRVVAVQKFLNAQTAGRRGDFQVLIHDPSEVGVPGAWGGVEYARMIGRAVGGLPTGAGSTSGGAPAGGAAPPP
jgi:hypothetical protein